MRKHGDSAQGEGSEGGGLAERLGRILRAEGDEDLFVEGCDAEADVLRWLRALDLQVVGACRADERLKPLLKLNLSAGAAEDHLMAQLNQHFDAAEIGLLVRCLCVPLVSLRVGKVNKIGNMLFPTNIRGNLNLMLSPLSELRLIFCGDDGFHERLGGVNHTPERSEVSAEEISADRSGRSFLLKLPGDRVSYFWYSEKSRSVGSELLKKMNNLFQQRPPLSQLTGISQSRLDSFAAYLMPNALTSVKSIELKSGSLSDASSSGHSSNIDNQSSSILLKPPRTRQNFSQVGKTNPLYQGSLSPKSSTFKDGPGRTLSRSVVREKLKRHADCSASSLVSDMTIVSTSPSPGSSSPSPSLKEHVQDVHNHHDLPLTLPKPSPSGLPLSFLVPLSIRDSSPNIPISTSSLLSPHYCWCPPSPSFQHVATPSGHPSLMSDPLALPPLSSLLPTVASSLYIPTASCELNELPALDLPSLLPASSFVSMPNSQQILSFTPFVAEPIVHIPVIEVCSSGPGYFVSAGPAISSTIPLLPKLSNPLAPETESIAEKNARETLRMLMASAPSNPQLMNVVPVFTSVDENMSYIHGKKKGLVVSGNRGLYEGSEEFDAVAKGIACLRLTPSSHKDNGIKNCEDSDEGLVTKDHSHREESEIGKSKSLR